MANIVEHRTYSLSRPAYRFVDIAAIVGDRAAEVREAHLEITSLRKRADAYAPQLARKAYLAERERLISDGVLSDTDLAALGTEATWEAQYRQSSELLLESASRIAVASYQKFRDLYRAIDAALAHRLKEVRAAEEAVAKLAEVPYTPSSGASAIDDTLEKMRVRIANSDKNPAAAPNLRDYFAPILEAKP